MWHSRAACEEPHALAVAACHHPKAVVFDLVQPARSRRRLLCGGGLAGANESDQRARRSVLLRGERGGSVRFHNKSLNHVCRRRVSPGHIGFLRAEIDGLLRSEHVAQCVPKSLYGVQRTTAQ
jgi:hypothetical protein